MRVIKTSILISICIFTVFPSYVMNVSAANYTYISNPYNGENFEIGGPTTITFVYGQTYGSAASTRVKLDSGSWTGYATGSSRTKDFTFSSSGSHTFTVGLGMYFNNQYYPIESMTHSFTITETQDPAEVTITSWGAEYKDFKSAAGKNQEFSVAFTSNNIGTVTLEYLNPNNGQIYASTTLTGMSAGANAFDLYHYNLFKQTNRGPAEYEQQIRVRNVFDGQTEESNIKKFLVRWVYATVTIEIVDFCMAGTETTSEEYYMKVENDGHKWNNNAGTGSYASCYDANMNDPSQWVNPRSSEDWDYEWTNFARNSNLQIDMKEDDRWYDDPISTADLDLDFDWAIEFLSDYTIRTQTGFNKMLTDHGGTKYVTVGGVSIPLFDYHENYTFRGIDNDHGLTINIKISNIRGY